MVTLLIKLIRPGTFRKRFKILMLVAFLVFGFLYMPALITGYGSEWAEQTWTGKLVFTPVRLIEPLLSDSGQRWWKQNAANEREAGDTSAPRQGAWKVLLIAIGVIDLLMIFFGAHLSYALVERMVAVYVGYQFRKAYKPFRRRLASSSSIRSS